MDNRIALIPFTQKVIKKAILLVGKENSKTVDIEQLRNQIDDAILSEDTDIQDEIEKVLKGLRVEPRLALGIRALIRPLMTLILTITFVALIFGQVGFFGDLPEGPALENYKEVFTVFLAIYGPIIGFWFGERTAERAPKH
ncbi:hypothetical protein [Aestuariirhabdus haliotis]|uniref:hypothetical protein n=1 Tax=Aestuariirhabdus haliotis TaxID=2918751 RepID=UPI0020BED772|nr:hypothetical protein [Aestuariirhabdus haliotis]MCL6421682.1 hypothetical protein [Aestuariirhabdus haliotis]